MTPLDNEAGAGVSIPSLGRDVTLVGRDGTLEVLDTEVAEVASGSFRVVLITGGAGVGKTRIAAEAISRYSGEAARMSARSYRWGGTTSFGPWVEALDRHLRGRSYDEIRRLTGSSLDDLAAILASVAPLTRTPREPNRGRLLDSLAHLFTSLSEESCVLLAFDDLHLADASAWEALRYLARRLSGAPIGIFATARPSQLETRPISREVLLGLDDDGLLTRLDLAPLQRSHVATLAHEVLHQDPAVPSAFVPEQLVDWLMERSLGHPLFVIGLLRALAEEGADLTAPRLERIPQRISERVAVDLQTLDPSHRETLETLAVVDQRFELEGLRRLTGRRHEELGVALEALSNARLVAEHGTGPDLRYEIAHPIIQAVIYEEIGSARKSLLHNGAAHLMLESDRLGAAASHFARAGTTRDDEEAVDALFRAMEQAGERDLYQEALAVLEALLEVLPSGDPRWVRVLDSITLRSEWVLSHLAEVDAGTAIEAMRRVIEVLEGSADTRARALARFHIAAFLSFGEARLEEAEQACREAVGLFREAGDLAGELLATNELAWFHGCGGDFVHNARLAQEVLSRALAERLTHVATVAAGTVGFASGITGRFDAARRHFEFALDLANEADIGYRVAWAHAQGAHYLALGGYLEEAIRFGEMALDDHPAAPDAMALEDLAVAYWLRGRLEDAGTVLDRSAVRRPILGSRRRAWGSALAARVYAEMGQRSRAHSNLGRATSTYDDRFFIWSSWADWSAALLAWIDGDNSKALRDLIRLADWLEAAGAFGYVPLVVADLSEIAADSGDVATCEQAAACLSKVAEHNEGPLASWLASLVSARFHLVDGDPGTAIEAATEAVAGLDRTGYTLLAATGRQVLGQALTSRNRSAAVETLQRSADDFAACGAVWRRDRTLSMLNELGTRGRRAAAAIQGPASLSGREREVASLTAQGHTAYDVGRKLFIGKRTVETHLANIYAKLGINSKRELIQRSEEFGL